jgi:hypothetical protein
MDSVAKELNVQQLEDWYNVSFKEARKHIKQSFLKSYDNSIIKGI